MDELKTETWTNYIPVYKCKLCGTTYKDYSVDLGYAYTDDYSNIIPKHTLHECSKANRAGIKTIGLAELIGYSVEEETHYVEDNNGKLPF